MNGDTTEAMRAAFEAWAKSARPASCEVHRDARGNYRSSMTAWGWQVWKAAIAHLTPAAPAVADGNHTTDRSEAVNLARNLLEIRNCKGVTTYGVRVLAEAVMAMDAAIAHLTPAAPAVADGNHTTVTDAEAMDDIRKDWADSTHTGAAPDALRKFAQFIVDSYASANGLYQGKHLARLAEKALAAAPPPPAERNNREPVAWKAPEPAYFDMPDARPAGRRKAEGERRSPARFAAYTVAMLHEAHTAGRHYCERGGQVKETAETLPNDAVKLSGSTPGVHTCTPPGYEVERAIKEGELHAAVEAYLKARSETLDTNHNRKLLEAGFDRGWDAATKANERKKG